MAPAGTHIEANGHRIYYEVRGEGEPLLLVHGGTASSTSGSWPSSRPRITASSKRKRASSTRSPWISFSGIRAIDQLEEKTVTLPKTSSREEPSVLATNSRTGRFVCCLGGRRDDAKRMRGTAAGRRRTPVARGG